MEKHQAAGTIRMGESLMPKLKMKPTPTQARILKAFIAHPKTGLYYCNGRCSWTGHNSWLAKKISGKPSPDNI